MAARRRRNLLSSRRRVEDDGEEDVQGAPDATSDSGSDVSILSDAEGDVGMSVSDMSDTGTVNRPNAIAEERMEDSGTSSRPVEEKGSTAETAAPAPTLATGFSTTADTNAMMHGLELSGDASTVEAVEFEEHEKVEASNSTKAQVVPLAQPTTATRRGGAGRGAARESEDTATLAILGPSNPAFVPNRGGFFMHDQRNEQYRGGFGGRGRGRGRVGPLNGLTSQNIPALQTFGNSGRWDHDLHETLSNPIPPLQQEQGRHTRPLRSSLQEHSEAHRSTLSSTISLGSVLVKVYLPGMVKPVNFPKTPVKLHTRLPDVRSPLRRDKPVRVFLPGLTARHIFPSTERSFVFIPRALRPNQQVVKGRGRASFVQASSRRGSTLGDGQSSIAVSGRSSQAPERPGSPADKSTSRPPMAAPASPSKPVVRLPVSTPNSQVTGSLATPVQDDNTLTEQTHTSSTGQDYPAPSIPTFRENRGSDITLHQPRPQKAVSVADIESPRATLPYHAPPQQELQPFYHQVPQHMSQSSLSQDGSLQHHARRISFQGQGMNTTPLSNIAERAVNAQPFQPSGMTYANAHPMYYYPPADGSQMSYTPGSNAVPNMYMAQPQDGNYAMPMYVGPAPVGELPQTTQPGMYAHESNGMVYYYESPQFVNSGEGVAQTSYVMPSMLGPPADSFVYAPNQPLMYYPAPKS